jgi:hypothetical protein
MSDYDYLSDSSSINEYQIELHDLKKEHNKLYLKIELLEQELYEKNIQIIIMTDDLNSYKKYFYYALSGCVFWAYFSVITNMI